MQTFSQNIVLRKTRRNDKNLGTIFIRLTINGTRTEFSSNRTCDPSKWNSSTSRLNGKSEEVKSFNGYLQAIEHRIYEIHRELIASELQSRGKPLKIRFRGYKKNPEC